MRLERSRPVVLKHGTSRIRQFLKDGSALAGLKILVIGASILLMLFYLVTSSNLLSGLVDRRNISSTAHINDAPAVREASIGLDTVYSGQISENSSDPLPQTHEVERGETLYGIAEKYGLSVFSLIRWNRINQPTKLRPDQILHLQQPVDDRTDRIVSPSPPIKADRLEGTAPLKVSFSSNSSLVEGSFMWDMGTWDFSFEPNPVYTFSEPGLYSVRLRVYGSSNTELAGNRITVRVHPGKHENSHFLTLSRPGDSINLNQWIDSGGSGYQAYQNPVLFEEAGSGLLKAFKGGYTRILVQEQNTTHSLYTFVSPYPSVHSREPDFNWYKTQFGTGILGNCGPSVVAMSSFWASGIDTSVATVRAEIGLPFSNGAINFEHMLEPLRKRGVMYRFQNVRKSDDVREAIDRGNIAVLLIHTSKIAKAKDISNLVGRYYNDSTGHYIIVKGYTKDGKYFIVYDPIPSDWKNNPVRYEDGVSMLGRNRFYPVTQVMNAMRRGDFLEIVRS